MPTYSLEASAATTMLSHEAGSLQPGSITTGTRRATDLRWYAYSNSSLQLSLPSFLHLST